jgi:hypothetical protein
VLKSFWRGDTDSERVLRAISDPPFNTSDFWAQQSTTVLPTLAPAAAASKLMDAGTSISLAGIQTVKLPFIDSTTVPPTPFVGEMTPIPVVDLFTKATTLGPVKKIAIISTLTEEIQAASGETASQIIGEALNIAIAKSLDGWLFSANPSSPTAPAGILNGVAPQTPSGETGFNGVADDLAILANAIAAGGVNPENMMIFTDAGTAWKIKVLAPQLDNVVHVSIAIPAGTIIAVVPEGFSTGTGSLAPSVDIVNEPEIHMNTTPLAIVDNSGSVAAPTMSLFQQGLLGIRLKAPCTWALHPGAVAWMQAVQWMARAKK